MTSKLPAFPFSRAGWTFFAANASSLAPSLLPFVDRAKEVTLAGRVYPVRHTAKRRLAQVDFEFASTSYRALEQNPETKSRWAQFARNGSKVMQFLCEGRYLAVAVDGKLTHYASA